MIGMIAAVTSNYIIGIDGKLPFNYPEDLDHFKNTTLNSVVIMGRKTFESIGKPLKNRKNIIISSSLNNIAGTEIYNNLEEAIIKYKNYNVWLIGGASIYEEGIKYVDTIVLTITPDVIYESSNYKLITKFPDIDITGFDLYNIKYINTTQGIKLKVLELHRKF